MRRIALIAVLALTLGCHKTVDEAIRVKAGTKPDVLPHQFDALTAPELARSPYELVSFTTPEGKKASFTVRAVELDDRGSLFDPLQIDRVREGVAADASANGAIIVVFVHGWNHNAMPCDDNLSCFRQVLKNLTEQEVRTYGDGARAVSGVYVGWRGLSRCHRKLRYTSFWNRKATGFEVGASQVRELLQNLRDVHEEANESRGGRRESRLVIVGHSFGAAVVYSAVAADLRQSFYAAKRAVEGNRYPRIDGFGDLVVLLNPAFEAQQFADIKRDSVTKYREGVRFADDQRPVLAVISSEGDGPTHYLFPLGQTANLSLQPLRLVRGPSYWGRHVITIGNHPSFWTHKARERETWNVKPPNGADEMSNCWQGQIPATGDCTCGQKSVREILEEKRGAMSAAAVTQFLAYDGEKFGNVELIPVGAIEDDRNPYLIISAAREVSSGHNDIFNPTLVSLLEGLVVQIDRP